MACLGLLAKKCTFYSTQSKTWFHWIVRLRRKGTNCFLSPIANHHRLPKLPKGVQHLLTSKTGSHAQPLARRRGHFHKVYPGCIFHKQNKFCYKKKVREGRTVYQVDSNYNYPSLLHFPLVDLTFMVPESCFLFLIFIYLAASGLICGTWYLHCIMWGLFVVAHGLSSCGLQARQLQHMCLVAPVRVRYQFPDQFS